MSEKYLIVGAGRSGICSGQLLSALGKDFVIFDGNADLDKKAVSEKIGCDKEIEFILGTAEKEQLQGIDICVVSPGVPLETDIMQKVISAGFWEEIVSGRLLAPFVFETDDGDMAAGGIFCTSREWVRQCVIGMIVTGVMRNHEKGMQSSVVPVFSDGKPNKLLTVSAIPASSERRNDLDDYAKLEVFLSEWLDGYPGMFV